jgi:predicted metal-dependent hydrolase
VNNRAERIARWVKLGSSGPLDPHYHGYFECFNRGLYYEAHEVLEHLWQQERHGPDGAFYKGLIQLAGAFVHLKKNRLPPSAALLRLARANLARYPASHRRLALPAVLALIDDWLARLTNAGSPSNPLLSGPAPRLRLQ